MRRYLVVGIGFIVCTVFIGGIHHAVALTEVGASTDASAEIAPKEPQEEKSYCWSGATISVDVGLDANGGVAFSKAIQGFDLNFTPASQNSANIVVAKTCKVDICPNQLGAHAPLNQKVLATEPQAAKRAETCTDAEKRGMVNKQNGCFTKCLEHGEGITESELKGAATTGVGGLFSSKYQSQQTLLEQGAEKGLSGAETKKLVDDSRGMPTDLYAALLDDSGKDTTAVTAIGAQSNNIAQELEQYADGEYLSGSGISNPDYFDPILAKREELRLPSAAEASSLDPFANVTESNGDDFVVGNCGGQPCLINEQAAGAPASVTGDTRPGSLGGTTFGGSNDTTPQIRPPSITPPGVSGGNSGGLLGGAVSNFTGGFLKGVTDSILKSLGLAPQTPAQQQAAVQQKRGDDYCKQRFNAAYNAKSNQCTCASGYEFQNNSCVATTAATPTITADLTCAPAVADDRTPIAVAWSCSDSSPNTTAFNVTSTGFNTGNKASGSIKITAQPPSSGDNMSLSLTCAKQNVRKTDSCDVEIRKPSLVFVAKENPYTPGDDVTLGWTSFGTKSCTVSSPDVPRISGPGAQGGVRKIKAEELLPQTRVFVSCETAGGNFLEGSIIIADTETSVQQTTQLVVPSH